MKVILIILSLVIFSCSKETITAPIIQVNKTFTGKYYSWQWGYNQNGIYAGQTPDTGHLTIISTQGNKITYSALSNGSYVTSTSNFYSEPDQNTPLTITPYTFTDIGYIDSYLPSYLYSGGVPEGYEFVSSPSH